MAMNDGQSPMDQALEWCVRLHDAGVSDAEREAFAQWLSADERHASAWLRAQQVWCVAGVAGQAFVTRQAPARPPARRMRWAAWACAAAVLLAVLLPNLSAERWADYRTTVAQTRTITLEDGSSIQMAPQTALDIDFTAQQRRIHLYRGEAWFKVAANPARPFVVEAGDGNVRALGTAFDVKRAPSGVEVIVTEHAVRVTQRQQQVDVAAGQGVRYDPAGISAPQSADIAQQLAWREQRLVFRDTPLHQVVERLRPYTSAYLLVTDETLGRLSITAAVDTRQVDAALGSLQVILPIEVTRIGPWLTLIRAANKPAEKS